MLPVGAKRRALIVARVVRIVAVESKSIQMRALCVFLYDLRRKRRPFLRNERPLRVVGSANIEIFGLNDLEELPSECERACGICRAPLLALGGNGSI